MSRARAPWVVLVVLIVSAVAIAAAAAILASRAVSSATRRARAARKPQYLRIIISPECTVYVEFHKDQMRVATAPEALAAAPPIRSKGGDSAEADFKNVALPVPADKLPPGFSHIAADFSVSHFGFGLWPFRTSNDSFVFGEILLSRQDDRGALWTYVTRAFSDTAEQPEQAPEIWVPRLDRLALTVVTAPKRNRIGVGLRVNAGREEVEDIRTDGKSVTAEVRVLDSGGRVVASATGPLSKFGFG